MSHSDDPVDEVERALMQIPYLLAQGIETAARVRVMRAERREHMERADAEADVRAAAEAARRLQSDRAEAVPGWQRADDRTWVRGAEPTELFATWATAAAWQEHDRGAAASAQRAEAEMRRRWPAQMRLYDDARMTGLSACESMRNMVTTVTNAGWDPTRRARPHPAPGPHPVLASGPGARTVDAAPSPSAVERAFRHLPTVPDSPPHRVPAAAAARVHPSQQPERRTRRTP